MGEFAALAIKASAIAADITNVLHLGQLLVYANQSVAPAEAALVKLIGGQALTDDERTDIVARRHAASADIARVRQAPSD